VRPRAIGIAAKHRLVTLSQISTKSGASSEILLMHTRLYLTAT
jgi:hypothetical protein